MANQADASIIFDTRFDANGFDKGMENIDKSFEKMQETVLDVASATDSAFGEKQQAKIGKTTEKLIRQMEAINAQKAKVEALKAEYDKIANADVQPKSLRDMESQIKRNNQEVKLLDAEFEKLMTTQGRLQMSEQAEIQLRGAVDPETSGELQLVDQQMEALGERIRTLNEQNTTLQASLERVRLSPETSEEAQKLEENLEQAGQKLTRLTSEASGTEEALKKAMDEKPARKMAKGFGLVQKAAAGLGKAIKNMGKDSHSTSTGFDKLVRKIYNLVRTVFIFSLIRKGLRLIQTEMGALLNTNADFTASLNAIKVNLATAFQPIYEAILPALNILMTTLSNATYYIASFISLLFGKSYSESRQAAQALQEEKDALKGVGAAAKDAGKNMAKFDDINQQTADTAGGATGGFGNMFDQVEEPEMDLTWLETFTAKLTELMPDLEYFETLGENLAQKIIGGLGNIKWDKVQAWADSFASKIAGFLNGAIANDELWKTVGETLAKWFNTALTFLHTFAEDFNWDEFGTAIGNGINKFFKEFNWSLAAATLTVWALGMLSAMIDAITEVDWEMVGTKIREFIVGIDWDTLLNKVFEAIGLALEAIYDFMVGLFGKPVADMLTGIGVAIAAFVVASEIATGVNNLAVAFLSLDSAMIGKGILMIGIVLATMVALSDLSPGLTILLGILAGAFVALGVAMTIGFGPLGWIVGAIAGLATAFTAIFIALGKDVVPEATRFSDEISEATRNILSPIIDNADAARKKLLELFAEGKPIIREDTLAVAGYFKDMADTAISELEKMKNAAIENLTAIFGAEAQDYENRVTEANKFYDDLISEIVRKDTMLSDSVKEAEIKYGIESEQYKAALSAYTSYVADTEGQIDKLNGARAEELTKIQANAGDEVQAYLEAKEGVIEQYDAKELGVKEAQDRLNEQLKQHLKDGGTMEDEHYKTLLASNEEFLGAIEDALVESDTERLELTKTRNGDLDLLEKQHISEVLKAHAKDRDESIKVANQKYSGMWNEAYELKKAGKITEDEFNAMLEIAKTDRDANVAVAVEKYQTIQEKTTSGMEGINTEINLWTGEIQSKWSSFWTGVGNWFGGWWKKVTGQTKEGAQEVGDALTDGLTDSVDNNKGNVEDAWSGALGDTIEAGNTAMGIASPSKVTEEQGNNLIDGLLLAFENGTPLLKAAIKTLMDTIYDVIVISHPNIMQVFTNMYNDILGKTETFANRYLNAIHSMCRQTASLLSSLPDAPTINVPAYTTMAIPKLARGGLINSATVAMIGERGREAVLPLDRNTEWAELMANLLAEKMSLLGLRGGQGDVIIQSDATLGQLIRLLRLELSREDRRSGGRVTVTGGNR